MTAGDGLVCDIPAPHDGPVRPYPCGPRCSTHSPWRAKGLPEPPAGPGAPRDWAPEPAYREATDRDRRHLAVVSDPPD
ncbi:hypothetical protein GCM10010216_51620 [Streptomyces flaveolus]|nr:hypothetical protein GCM10010216_51620 [Streptomyces flaveolus]